MHESDLDGVQLAVITSRLEGIVRNMMNTLVRTGRSGVLNTARDFSCCILSADDELLAMAESLPIHMMSGPDLMARYMRERHPELRRGDAFLHNDPYHGNSHAADHSILVPVVDDDGTHRFTVLAKAHQADCGNSAPTTYYAAATDVYNEGALVFPCVAVQRDYEFNHDIVRMCRRRIRVPDQWWGDFLAVLGAARIGERLLLEFGSEAGWDTLDRYRTTWLRYSEQRMREAIRQLPQGTITVNGAHDPFPGVPDGIPIQATIHIEPSVEEVTIDLTDNPDCQPCGLNLTEATSKTAALVGVFDALHSDIPINAGSIAPVNVLLRHNCVVGIPQFPASCSVATTNLADRVVNLVQRGIAELCDRSGLAEAGLIIPPAGSVISGTDTRPGRGEFVNQILLPGYGAGPGGPLNDGWLTLAHPGGAGVCFRDSVEIDEMQYPMIVHRQEIIPDSEGAGTHRGAPGSIVELGPHGTDMEILFVSDGSIHPASGARGGQAGARANQMKRTADGQLVDLEPADQVTLRPGETVISLSSAGGGYGPPECRDPERVAHDVAEGWITPERARDVYHVVTSTDGTIDAAATADLRRTQPSRAGDHP